MPTVAPASHQAILKAGPHLDRLVTRTAEGDQAAFRCLYAGLAMRVWRSATIHLPHHGAAPSVVRATFMEVWYTALMFDPTRDQAHSWITTIGTRRIDEQIRLAGPFLHSHAPGAATATAAVGYEAQQRRELAGLLGAGPATIRVAAGIFRRIDDLDHAITAIASEQHPGGTAQPTADGRDDTPL